MELGKFKLLFVSTIFILIVGPVFAYPNLDFQTPTETNNSYVSTNWAEINLTISINETLDTFEFDWEYSEADSNLVNENG